MPDYEVVIEQPPSSGRGQLSRNLNDRVDHPGEWARIGTYPKAVNASQTVRNIVIGARSCPLGQWEFSHGAVPGTENEPYPEYGVWARWLGPDPTGETDNSSHAHRSHLIPLLLQEGHQGWDLDRIAADGVGM